MPTMVGVREEYRRRKHSDVWHFHPACRWWPVLTTWNYRYTKPKGGEFCNECLSKERRYLRETYGG